MSVFKKELIFFFSTSITTKNGHYTIGNDACDTQERWEVPQKEKQKYLKPIGYCSVSPCGAESWYDTMHKECEAVVWAVLILKSYPKCSRILVSTDYQTLSWILNLKEFAERQVRWKLRLVEFDFRVLHRPRKYHQAAIAMSRTPQKASKKIRGYANVD